LLQLTARREAGLTYLMLQGELDVDTIGFLKEQCRPVPGSGLVLDLAEVSFVDSSGLRGLLEIYRCWEGRVALARVRPEIREVLEVVGLAELLAAAGEEGNW
jgi:anti-anti-sigma factor